jgi:MFS family permease
MPKELATRISIFYCASSLSGAFSGLLAAGIAEMDGVGGYSGWQWIFILEGIITIVLGVMTFFLLIDSPRLSGKWLNPEEIRYLELQTFIKQGGRVNEEKENKFQWGELKAVLTNPRVYGQAYILLAISACSYGKSIRDICSWYTITNMIDRQQVHSPFHHKGNGLLKHQRSVDDSPSIHRWSPVSSVLRPPF